MKKLLVVLMAAMMVLSMAAASMAAATVSGDWRWEWTMNDGAPATDHFTYSKSDLRFNFNGKVSDSVDAYLQVVINDSAIAIKEYKVTFKQSFGTITTGYWDYKLAPSRVLLKAHQALNCVNNKKFQVLAEVPFADNFTFGLYFTPFATRTADYQDSYDLKLAYKAESFGAEIHYGNAPAIDDADYIALDFYYDITKDIKATLVAVSVDDQGPLADSYSDDGATVEGLDVIVGLVWKNIAGSKLTGSLEIDMMENAAGENQIAAQFKYGFTNKVNLEVELFGNYKNTDANYYVVRPRVKF